MRAHEALRIPEDRAVVVHIEGEEPHEWPHYWVRVLDDRVVVHHEGVQIASYPYVSKEPLPNGWRFVGPQEDFTVRAGGMNFHPIEDDPPEGPDATD